MKAFVDLGAYALDLAADLVAVQSAWRNGHVERVRGRHHTIVVALEIFGAVLALGTALWLRLRVNA